jgi:P4 family phage/plasmid primase-like protien
MKTTTMNLGVQTGALSGNLFGVDPDDAIARRLASSYVPETGMESRRKSVDCSARFYWVPNADLPGQMLFTAPGETKALVEIRGDRHQSMVPPSVHPETGETVFWSSSDGLPHKPAVLSQDELLRGVRRLAVATLLARYWKEKSRNNLAFHLTGWLARAEWEEEEIIKFMVPITIVAGDGTNREDEIHQTYRKYHEGFVVAGRSKVVEIIGADAAKKIAEWLDLQPVLDHPPSLSDLDGTDVGNAAIFAERNANRERWSPDRGWMTWRDTHWKTGDEAGALDQGKQLVRALILEAALEPDLHCQKRQLGRAKALASAKRIGAMLQLTRSDQRIYTESAALDRHRYLFNAQNGTLDLHRESFSFKKHDPGDLITRIAGALYDRPTPCPRWDQYLSEVIPDPAERRYLQRLVGAALTGELLQYLFLLVGPGGNGKTVFLRVLCALLGTYAVKASFNTFLHKKFSGIPIDIARLAGARLVVAIEGPEGRRLNESLEKGLTGGDVIAARFLYREFFEFPFTGKIFLAANYLPQINDPSDAMWRRIRIIPFNVSIPECQQDPRLLDKLLSELPGILNWAIEGCLAWQETGLDTPEVVTQSTQLYRSESDILADFLSEACVMGPELRVTAKALYTAYQKWAHRTEQRWTLGKHDFNQRMRTQGFKTLRPGDRPRYF